MDVQGPQALSKVRQMKCCGKERGGTPYVMMRYWCEDCKTEHLVNAEELTAYVAKLAAEKSDGVVSRLPDLL